jgi:hypothetical protein
MLPPLPFWAVQRQVKVEPVGDEALTLKAPNLPAHELTLRAGAAPGTWQATVHRLPPAEGGDKVLLGTQDFSAETPTAAWENAFEFFRQTVII